MEYVIRFLAGGIIVSLFAVIGDMLRPRNFAGLFGAAPTVGLATLGLAFATQGAQTVATEGRSMLLGAAALGVYSLLTGYLLVKFNWHSLPAALVSLLAWFVTAFGLWALLLR